MGDDYTPPSKKLCFGNKVGSNLMELYNEKLGPIINKIEEVRSLTSMDGNPIPLPTIAVLGGPSSGKSSVIESLTGICLPKAFGICTRSPLIIKLQHIVEETEPPFVLQYPGHSILVTDETISDQINIATDEITRGDKKAISHTPITLTVKKNSVPNLTLIDLPGVTLNHFDPQPEDLSLQLSALVESYIKSQDTIILLVLSVVRNIADCPSIPIVRRVDPKYKRTLCVLTMCDMNSNAVRKKATVIGELFPNNLGAVFVINNDECESIESARSFEEKKFESMTDFYATHKSVLGTRVLMQKLVTHQSNIIYHCLPRISNMIKDRLRTSINEQNNLPHRVSGKSSSLNEFLKASASYRDYLAKVLHNSDFLFLEINGGKCSFKTCVLNMLEKLLCDLQGFQKFEDNFLDEELELPNGTRDVPMPYTYSHKALLSLNKKKVDITVFCLQFVDDIIQTLETVVLKALPPVCEYYPSLSDYMETSAKKVILNLKKELLNFVEYQLKMEKASVYTSGQGYLSSYKKIIDTLTPASSVATGDLVVIPDYKPLIISNLVGVSDGIRNSASSLKVIGSTYWTVSSTRIVDQIALWIFYQTDVLIKKFEEDIRSIVVDDSGRIEELFAEPKKLDEKRKHLQKSIATFQQAIKIMNDTSSDIVMDLVDT